MSSSANLSRRLSQLETMTGETTHGPAVIMEGGETHVQALARHEAEYGKQEGEPFFIRLIYT